MPELQLRLFGKFSAIYGAKEVDGLAATRVQELLAYLMLRRDRQHPRETLAGMLWSVSTAAQSKKYLRQALWQLQTAIESGAPAGGRLLDADDSWLHLNPGAALWLDIDEFERAFLPVQGIPGQAISDEAAHTLQNAVQLYRGELLDGWYQDWCLYERERLQSIYLAMLDKLAANCESHQRYEAGLQYAGTALRYDRADERTHRRLMKLHYLIGDRTAALRQYERCCEALGDELGVKPAKSTVLLHEQIRADLAGAPAPPLSPALPAGGAEAPLSRTLGRLAELQEMVAEIQRELQRDLLAHDSWSLRR